MTPAIQFHPPRWELQRACYERVCLWHLPLRRPLSQVFWVWDAPALTEYHPVVRNAFLSLLKESQPERLASLSTLGFRLSQEIHLDGIITGLQGLSENLPEALEILYCLWTEVSLTEGVMRPIVERMARERQRAWAYPSFRASAYLEKHLWQPPYAPSSHLPPEAIQTLSAKEVRRFYEELLRKSLRHIIVVAPAVPRVLFRWMEWQGVLHYRLPLHSPSWGWYTEADESARQVSLRLAYAGLRRNHPDYPLYRLALTHLGGYFGSLLMQEIREKGGYTYGIYAQPTEAWAGSYFTIESEIDKARSTEAIQKVLDIVSAWAEKPFSDEETLLQTRNYLIARLSPETPSEWAHTIARLLLHGYGPQWYIQNAERISTLELSDYERWRGDIFSEPIGAVVVGSPAPIFAA